MRPVPSRARGIQSFNASLAMALFLAAVAVVIFITVGGGGSF